MKKVIALAGQVRAKRGCGTPSARLVCLVFVSRASNSMLSNLAPTGAYCPLRTSFSAAACSQPQRETASHISGDAVESTKTGLEPNAGPARHAASGA